MTLVDTAEVYGYQNIEHGASAEHLVGKVTDDARKRALRRPALTQLTLGAVPRRNACRQP